MLSCCIWLLTGCSTSKAVVWNGTIQAYMPTPNTGLGFYVDNDTVVNQAQIGLRTYDKESMPLSGLINKENFLENGSPAFNKKANISYRMIRVPVTASFDHYKKDKSSLEKIGLGLNPFPYIDFGLSKLSRFVEAGLAINIGVALEQESLKGEQIYIEHTLSGDMDDKKDKEWDGEWKMTGALEGYFSILPLKNLALTYSFTGFYPQLFDNLGGYSLSFDFPPIFMNYVGFSYLFAKKYKISLGAVKYVDYKLKNKYWHMESSIGYIF